MVMTMEQLRSIYMAGWFKLLYYRSFSVKWGHVHSCSKKLSLSLFLARNAMRPKHNNIILFYSFFFFFFFSYVWLKTPAKAALALDHGDFTRNVIIKKSYENIQVKQFFKSSFTGRRCLDTSHKCAFLKN